MNKNEPPERTHPMNALKGVFASDGAGADEADESFCTSLDCVITEIFQQKKGHRVCIFVFGALARSGQAQGLARRGSDT
jgi:hypothetical protein